MSHEDVKEYYGKTLKETKDLKTNCCMTSEKLPQNVLDAIKEIHDDVLLHYYGCGIVIPTELEGITALDLGSGSGRDCYILSKLVGENGFVYGVDMTEEQLAIANKYKEFHREQFHYKKSNVEFIHGYIEDLKSANIKDNSIDLIVSNCVINLCPKKEDVLKECYRVLKEGGEIYFSDVYSDKRVPQCLKEDKVLYGECISGALYWNDFLKIAKEAGFSSPRFVKGRKLTIENEEIEKKVNGYNFYSITFRLVKTKCEDDNEDFGDIVIYQKEGEMLFDHDNIFKNGIQTQVSRGTYQLLKASRYHKSFTFIEGKEHLGLFKIDTINILNQIESQKPMCCGKNSSCCCGSNSSCCNGTTSSCCNCTTSSCCNGTTSSCCSGSQQACCEDNCFSKAKKTCCEDISFTKQKKRML